MRSLAAWVVLAVGAARGAAGAQAPQDTLPLARALAIARQGNPLLQAARLRADAARERISQVGAPPDPELSLGLINRPLNFGTAEEMTMNEVRLTQTIPWPGKLGFSKARETQLAAASAYDAEETERSLLVATTNAYLEVAFVDRALVILADTRRLLRDLATIAATMYAVGSGLQQDVLQAQVAVARLTEDITVMEQARIAAAARLNALLGRLATAPVGALEFSEVPGATLPELDSLVTAAALGRPALAASRARVRASAEQYRAARRDLYPDLMLTGAYGQRPRFEDMVTVMVGVSLPIWAARRQLASRREAQALELAAEGEALNLWNDTYARLAAARAQAERSQRLARLYSTAVIPQSEASVTAALAAYRAGQVNFLTVVENRLTTNRYKVEGLRLASTYQSATAEIRALAGEAAVTASWSPAP